MPVLSFLHQLILFYFEDSNSLISSYNTAARIFRIPVAAPLSLALLRTKLPWLPRQAYFSKNDGVIKKSAPLQARNQRERHG